MSPIKERRFFAGMASVAYGRFAGPTTANSILATVPASVASRLSGRKLGMLVGIMYNQYQDGTQRRHDHD